MNKGELTMPLNLQAIKARLAATTAVDGHWSYNKDDSTLYKRDDFYKETNELVHGPVVMHEDGEFIANAPLDIKMLIAEIELEQKHRLNAMDLIEKLQQEKEQLRKALEFYADEKKYSTHMNEFGFYLPVCVGKGETARKVLDGDKQMRTPEQNALIDKVIANLQALDGEK